MKKKKQDLSDKNKKLIASGVSLPDLQISLSDARKQFFPSGRWLGATNRYAEDTIDRIRADLKPGKSINQRHLAAYIAVSTALHCSDGWSYLGRAVQATLSGDANGAKHLAYYAELRAAMSLLACEGVGVFNDAHFAVSGAHKVTKFPHADRTHMFVWKCLAYWASRNSARNLFARVVRPRSVTLEDWLTPVGGGKAFAPHARSWFRQWGVDLKWGSEDREARNTASYRPSALPVTNIEDVDRAIGFVRELWEVLEPSGAGGFANIDQYVLRSGLEGLHLARTDKTPKEDPAGFADLIRPIVAYQNLAPDVANQWTAFLTRAVASPDPELFTLAQMPPGDAAHGHFAVISRAALLLRIASGATAEFFSDAAVKRSDVGFWRQAMGANHGLWSDGGEPANLGDLYEDIRLSLANVELFEQKTPRSYHLLVGEFGELMASLGSCERVALWTVAAA